MRVVMTDTSVEEFRCGSHDALPVSSHGLSKKLVQLLAKAGLSSVFASRTKKADKKPAGGKSRIWSAAAEHGNKYRRDSFFFAEGFEHIPRRAFKRHSAFLVYQKRYYQSLGQNNRK